MSLRELEQSHLDLSRIPALEVNRLTGFVNHVACSLIEQLNVLNNAADQRLHLLNSRISRCKTDLCILEKRLSSVKGLTSTATPANETPVPDQTPSAASTSEPETGTHVPSASTAEHDEAAAVVTSSSDGQTPDVTEDPELERFRKMLKVGVPLPAVRIKMSSEGLDPNRLKV